MGECILYSELTQGDEVDKTNSLSIDECLLYSELTQGVEEDKTNSLLRVESLLYSELTQGRMKKIKRTVCQWMNAYCTLNLPKAG